MLICLIWFTGCRSAPLGSPAKDIGSLSPDDSTQARLATYEVNDNWKGQLESSLFNMKATMPGEYPEMIATLNQFFSGKRIEAEIHPDSGNVSYWIQGMIIR